MPNRQPSLHLLLGGYAVEEILRGDVVAGCGIAVDRLGVRYHARWVANDSAEARRLSKEYEALCEIPHVCVPRPIARFSTSSHAVLIREYVEGCTLDLCSPVHRQAWAEQLASLVDCATQADWIHGDICPKNLVVTPQGDLCLIDWELAARSGEQGAPGTLGWTPRDAWNEDFAASPSTDRYAASVVVWELFNGRRAFVGDRAEIARSQQATQLHPPEGVGELTSTLFTRREGAASFARLEKSKMDWDRIAQRSVRECIRATPLLREAEQLKHGGSVSIAIRAHGAVTPLQIESEISQLWMRSGRGHALCASRSGQSMHDAPRGSRVDDIRAVCEMAEESARACKGATLIVYEVDPREERLSAPWEIETHVARRLTDPQGSVIAARWWRDASGKTEATSTLLREALTAMLGPGAASLASAGAQDLHDLTLEEFIGVAERIGLGEQALAHSRDELPTATHSDSVSRRLRSAEYSLVQGNTKQAYIEAVRLTSEILAGEQVEDADRLRLAEVWRELGAVGAALWVARSVAAPGPRAHSLLSIASASDSAADIEAVVEEHAKFSSDEHLVARARAAAYLHRRQLTTAHRTLRKCSMRPLRRTGNKLALYALAMMSTSRAIGRTHSARRLARVAARAGSAGGTARVRWLAEFGSLITREDSLGTPRAGELEALASAAAGRGLWTDARRMALRAARALIDEGLYERATARVQELRCDGQADIFGGGLLDGALERVEWSAGSALELRWALSNSSNARDREVAALRALVQHEWRNAWGEEVNYGAARGSAVARASDLVHRDGRRVSGPSRAWRCARIIASRLSDLPGSAVATCRPLLMSGWYRSGRDRLLSAAVRESDGQGASGELALALICVAVAWRQVVADEAMKWAAAARRGFVGGRPAGVRRWEWTLASHVISSYANGQPMSKSVLHEAGQMFNQLAVELPIELRSQYVALARGQTALPKEGAGEPALEVPAALVGSGSRISARVRDGCADRSLEATLECCIRAAVEETGSERGVIILDRGDGRPRAKVVGRVGNESESDIQVCHSVLARAEEQGSVLVIDDAVGDPALADRPSVKRFHARSVAVVPMLYSSRRIGYLYLETRSARRSLNVSEIGELAAAGAELSTIIELAAMRDENLALKRDRERLISQADRKDELARLGQHVGEVVHDLNGVLTVVKGEAELAIGGEHVPIEVARSIDAILKQAADGERMVRRILTLVRGGAGEERELVNVYDVAEEALFAARARLFEARRRGAEIEVALAGARRASVYAAGSELREVFSNLIGNAIDAMSTGGRLAIEIRAEDLGPIRVAVSDTGSGMTEETLRHAFDPFYSTKGSKGNGLGLAICRSFVERFGGRIAASSELGKGTTFEIVLPQAERSLSAGELVRALRS